MVPYPNIHFTHFGERERVKRLHAAGFLTWSAGFSGAAPEYLVFAPLGVECRVEFANGLSRF